MALDDLGLPALGRVIRRLERLEQYVFMPFPDFTDPRLRDDADARERALVEADVWARRISWIIRGQWNARRQMKQTRPLWDQFTWSRLLSQDCARDIIGEAPASLQLSCQAGVINLGVEIARNAEAARLDEAIADIDTAYRITFFQVMGAVADLRRRFDDLALATVPKITVQVDGSAVVSQAGRTMEVSLTPGHVEVLRAWKQTGIATVRARNHVTGTAERSLLGRIPTLRPFVSTVPNGSHGPDGGTYRLAAPVREHLSLEM